MEVEGFLKSIDTLLSSEAGIATVYPVEGNKKEKAKLLFLKGKILDLLPTYEKGAEDCLNKSV